MKSLALLLSCLLLMGCAFTRRENRPVWNTFERHLVPDDRGWFVAALPLTVPGGLLAILADTLIAHPIQVSGDAFDDAASLWRHGRPDFAQHYYSEMAFLPLRGALTPVTFAGSFLGRSMFAIDTADAAAARTAQRQAEARQALAEWLQSLRSGDPEPFYSAVPELDEALRQQLLTTAATADALARLQLYRVALREDAIDAVVPALDGLRDGDAGVRFAILEALPRGREVPADLREQLCHDAVDSIRLEAQRRWPQR